MDKLSFWSLNFSDDTFSKNEIICMKMIFSA